MILVKDNEIMLEGTAPYLVAETCGVIIELAADAKRHGLQREIFEKAFLRTAISAIKKGYEEETVDEDKQG